MSLLSRFILLLLAIPAGLLCLTSSVSEIWGGPQIEYHIYRATGQSAGWSGIEISDRIAQLDDSVSIKKVSIGSQKLNVAVFHDWRPKDNFGKKGRLEAILLRNLLGHFRTNVTISPIETYETGDIDRYDVTFYLATYYNNPIPSSFYDDLLKARKPVVLIETNLWNISSSLRRAISAKYGVEVPGLHFSDPASQSDGDDAQFFGVVRYKGEALRRDRTFNKTFAKIRITDPGKVRVWAYLENQSSGRTAPYITQSGNLWLVADSPFVAADADSPYLALCDLLHEILSVHHAERRFAMVRLEDVHARNPAFIIRLLNDFLRDRQVPYSISVIPKYRDPQGVYNRGWPDEIALTDWRRAADLRDILTYATGSGARIVMHGYTHQLDSLRGRAPDVSAEGYEFWNQPAGTPVEGETPRWVLGRLTRGWAILDAIGMAPTSFEVPHYKASPLVYRAVPLLFPKTYQRVTYFSTDNPRSSTNDPLNDVQEEQFFPYVILEDYYGQYIIPENIGHLQYNEPLHTADDILRNARKMTVVRDGIASFFIHPYLFHSAKRKQAWRDLEAVIDGISALGYEWTNDPRMDAEGQEIDDYATAVRRGGAAAPWPR